MFAKKQGMDNELLMMCHRHFMLQCTEIILILLQCVGMIFCTSYIVANFFYKPMNETILQLGSFSFQVTSSHLNILSFVVSIILLFSRPADLTQKINVLKMAIKYKKLEKEEDINDFHNDIINQAKQFLTEEDSAYAKKQNNEKEKIEPHEKRMVLRKRMIPLGIAGVTVLTIILVFGFEWNIPQIAALDILIGYILVIAEASYYQFKLKQAGICVMSPEHEKIIKSEGDLLGTSQVEEYQKQQYKLYQKVCYMKADRWSNYRKVLSVASAAINLIAICITILDSTNNIDLKKVFVLDIREVNSVIALILMIVSIILFFIDIFFQSVIDQGILESKAYAKMPYSKKNYLSLKRIYKKKISQNIFSRDSLDVGRAIYDFNIDVLVEKLMRGNDTFIPADCMLTLKDNFPGRIPRYKLTSMVIGLCGFCGFIWGRSDLGYLFPVVLTAFTVYLVLIFISAVQMWNTKQDWFHYEKTMNSDGCDYKSVRSFFARYYVLFSLIILALTIGYEIFERFNSLFELVSFYNFVGVLMAFFAIGTLTTIMGVKFINEQKPLRGILGKDNYTTILILSLGILDLVIKFILGIKFTVFSMIIEIVLIPVLIEIIKIYKQRIEQKKDYFINAIPCSPVILILNFCKIMAIFYYHELPLTVYLGILYTYFYLSVTALIFYRILYQVTENPLSPGERSKR